MSVSRTARLHDCMSVLHALLDDVSFSNGKANTLADKRTVSNRLRSEGVSFATKTLPILGKAFDTALKTGFFVCPSNFGHYKSTALPAFLRGLLLQVFESDGQMRDDPSPAAMCEIRQICYVFYKLIEDFSDSQRAMACEKFVQTDENLPNEMPHDHPILSEVLYWANKLLKDLLQDFDPFDIVPGHGPGVVATGEKPHEKKISSHFYKELHNVYPYYRYFYINSSHLLATCSHYWSRHRESTGINRVLFVPKDSRGPRTIACEPLEYQYIQQGIRRRLQDHIEAHPLTRGRVNFERQEINQEYARRGSLGEDYCTMDMKDASDSVSIALVRALFKDTGLLPSLEATRTPHSLLPDGRIVELKKFAAMGSALCFPIEALTFYSLLMGCYVVSGSPNPFGLVYGDDIILPARDVDFYIQVLEELGLKTNREKSCLAGSRFKESCGAEFFAGFDVSYQKSKTLCITEPQQLASVVETSNGFFARGFYNTARVYEKLARSSVKIPYGNPTSGFLCFHSPRVSLVGNNQRYNKRLQRWEQRVPFLKGIKYKDDRTSVLQTYGEYMRKHLQGWSDSFVAGQYARRAVKLSFKWVSVHD